MSKFNRPAPYTDQKSLNFIITIILLLGIGVIYVMTQKSDTSFANFILVGAAAITIIYWVPTLKKLVVENKPKYTAKEAEAKNWVYDLIRGDNVLVFVAEVPGPEDKIMVRFIDGILYIRGSGGFSKEVPIEGSQEMKITDFKYRNGVLTLRIH